MLFPRWSFVTVVNVLVEFFTFGLECGTLWGKKQTMIPIVHPTDLGDLVFKCNIDAF